MHGSMNKFVCLGLFLLLFSVSAFALDLHAPARVPQQTVWGFRMGLGVLDSFFEADASWNGQPLFKYVNGNIVDSFESGALVSTRRIGNTIFVTLLGEPEGTYRLVTTTKLSGGQTVEEKSQDVQFVSALDSSDREQLLNDLNVAQRAVDDLKAQTDELQNQLADQNNLTDSQSAQLRQQSEKLSTLQDALISLQQAMGSLTDFDSQSGRQLSELKTGLAETNQKVDQKLGTASTGLFGLADAGNWWMILLVVGIVAVALIAWQWKQNNP